MKITSIIRLVVLLILSTTLIAGLVSAFHSNRDYYQSPYSTYNSWNSYSPSYGSGYGPVYYYRSTSLFGNRVTPPFYVDRILQNAEIDRMTDFDGYVLSSMFDLSARSAWY